MEAFLGLSVQGPTLIRKNGVPSLNMVSSSPLYICSGSDSPMAPCRQIAQSFSGPWLVLCWQAAHNAIET